MKYLFDKQWTLFLDRDGVINKRLPGQYIQHWDQFEFEENSLTAIAHFAKIFGRILVVTNQQGIGKDLMTDEDLAFIHTQMHQAVHQANGRLDNIYYCPSLASDNDPNRKPNPGMAYLAKRDFPEIDFQQSIIIGDSLSDMEFGKNLGMKTVLVDTKEEEKERNKQLEVDFRVPSLYEFALKII